MIVHPIAFTQRERDRAPKRWVHFALDVNEQTLCGQRIAYVAAANVVAISTPKAAIPFSDLCIACEGRRIEQGLSR